LIIFGWGDRVFNKTIFAATAVAAFIAAPALAADLPVKAPPHAPVVGRDQLDRLLRERRRRLWP
jgi:hypothetical protein